jgi:hypothetical protein
MTKTKEEIIEQYLKENNFQANEHGAYIYTSFNEKHKLSLKWLFEEIFELGEKKGFEAFRGKVEEGVKDLEFKEDKIEYTNGYNQCIKSASKIIKGIKQ